MILLLLIYHIHFPQQSQLSLYDVVQNLHHQLLLHFPSFGTVFLVGSISLDFELQE